MNARKLFLITIPVIFFPMSILKADNSTENEKLFRQYDMNHDNVISIDEAVKYEMLFRQFTKIDNNHNEKLERSEFSAFEPIEYFQPPDLGEHEPGAGPLN